MFVISSSNFLLDDQQEKQRNDSKCENNGRITGKQRQNIIR